MSAVMNQPDDGLRPMLLDDIDEVMDIENRVYDFPWTGEIFRDCLRVGYICWVYRDDNELKAYGVMSIGAGEAHILTIGVKPEAQGQGLGRMIMQHLIQLANKRHVDKAFLEVRPTNRVAIGLYQSMGFDVIGKRKGYYPAENGREDAVVMLMQLAGSDESS
ncbi:MAG: ribosomal protein S18-alanine N-acetyltransferase [Gammaproteobacteria bacterium]|nr:ribosomal protein S18-alanine N-acetyltransferase [Gammaproteobacteria bacterium]